MGKDRLFQETKPGRGWFSKHLCVAALLVTNGHEGDAIYGGQTADDGWIIQASPVAMQLYKAVTDVQNDVQKGWPVGMPGYLEPLDRCQPCVCVPSELQIHNRNSLLTNLARWQ